MHKFNDWQLWAYICLSGCIKSSKTFQKTTRAIAFLLLLTHMCTSVVVISIQFNLFLSCLLAISTAWKCTHRYFVGHRFNRTNFNTSLHQSERTHTLVSNGNNSKWCVGLTLNSKKIILALPGLLARLNGLYIVPSICVCATSAIKVVA